MTFVILASPLIIKKGRILLVKRAKEPYRGYWGLPGGKVEAGEKPDHAVVREVKEETTLDFKNPKFINYFEHYYPDLKQHFFYLVFKGDVDGNIEEISSRIKLCAKEATEYGWFSKKDLKPLQITIGSRMITGNVRF